MIAFLLALLLSLVAWSSSSLLSGAPDLGGRDVVANTDAFATTRAYAGVGDGTTDLFDLATGPVLVGIEYDGVGPITVSLLSQPVRPDGGVTILSEPNCPVSTSVGAMVRDGGSYVLAVTAGGVWSVTVEQRTL